MKQRRTVISETLSALENDPFVKDFFTSVLDTIGIPRVTFTEQGEGGAKLVINSRADSNDAESGKWEEALLIESRDGAVNLTYPVHPNNGEVAADVLGRMIAWLMNCPASVPALNLAGRRREERTLKFMNFASRLNTLKDTISVMSEAANVTLKILQCDWVSMITCHGSTMNPTIMAGNWEFSRDTYDISVGVTGWAAKSRKEFFTADSQADASVLGQTPHHTEPSVLAAIPVFCGRSSKNITLGAGRREPGVGFTPREMQMLLTLASLVGSAIHRCLFLEDMDARVKASETTTETCEEAKIAQLTRELADATEKLRKMTVRTSETTKSIQEPDEIAGEPVHLGRQKKVSAASSPADMPLNIEELEKIAITRALVKIRGNMTKAAQLLGIGRVTLYRKMERYGISNS